MGFLDGMTSHDKLILAGMVISGFAVVLAMVLFSNASVNIMGKVKINYKGEDSNG